MRSFFVKQQDLIDPAQVSRPTADQAKFVEVVLRKDLPLSAMDVGQAISQVNAGFAVLSEQLDELAGMLQTKVRKNLSQKKREQKVRKFLADFDSSFLVPAWGEEAERIRRKL